MRLPEYLLPLNARIVQRAAELGQFTSIDYAQSILDNRLVQDPRAAYVTGKYKGLRPDSREIVIVGARSVPLVTVRHVFLALLTKPARISVKSPTEAEDYLLQEFLSLPEWRELATNTAVETFFFSHENPPPAWESAVKNATDVVVYGSEEAVEAYERLSPHDARLHIYGPKFSLQAIDLRGVGSIARRCAQDYLDYFGQGCMSPKYTLLVSDGMERTQTFLEQVEKTYLSREDEIRAFWEKQPIPVQSKINSDLAFHSIVHKRKYTPLVETVQELEGGQYGLSQFLMVQSVEDVEEHLCRASQRLAAVGTNIELGSTVSARLRGSGVRVCEVGRMQKPSFWRLHEGHDEYGELL